jgi:hypothetical protein
VGITDSLIMRMNLALCSLPLLALAYLLPGEDLSTRGGEVQYAAGIRYMSLPGLNESNSQRYRTSGDGGSRLILYFAGIFPGFVDNSLSKFSLGYSRITAQGKVEEYDIFGAPGTHFGIHSN